MDSQLRELLEKAVGEPPRAVSAAAVRRRVVRRRAAWGSGLAAAVAVVVAGVLTLVSLPQGRQSVSATGSPTPSWSPPSFRSVATVHWSDPRYLDCVTSAVCYAWFTGNGPGPNEATTNGGASWHRVASPARRPCPDG
jgi:hypothetical protein